MNCIIPPHLKPGDTVGFIAPSSPLNLDRLKAGIHYFEQKGFNVKLSAHLKNAERFLAGRDIDRANDIMDFFRDPEIKALIATAGGYGSQRLLSLLDYDYIRAHPKIVTGFSDTTALQLGLLKTANLVTYSGFTLRDTDPGKPDPLVEQTFSACLKGESYQIKEGALVNPGVVNGPLIGGNLALITALMGTPYQPNFKNSILLFEDVWAEPFQIDSRLSQLELAGVFDEVAGIIIGQFEHCISEHYQERDGTIEDVINEWGSRIKVPCIKDFPYGHSDRRCVLAIGGEITLDANNTTIIITSLKANTCTT